MLVMLNVHETFDVTRLRPDVRHLRIGLGWDRSEQPAGLWSRVFGRREAVDLDAACLLLDKYGELIDMVWFKKLRTLDDSVCHRGDSLDGRPASADQALCDDESIDVDLKKIADSVVYLFFSVCSYTGHNFKDIEQAHCRILNAKTDDELARFDLSRRGAHTGLIMAGLSRVGSGWQLQALGEPVNARTPEELLTTLQQWVHPPASS
jgi:tellurium resistance protein TerZ